MTPELRAALKELRRVRAERPGEELGAAAFAAWRVAVAEALEALAPLLLFAEDRQRAVAEARSARAEAAELRASGFDFPDVVVRALEHAGWRPDRSVDISAWDAELAGQGYRLHPVAAAALRSFGGLNLPPVNRAGPNFANDEPLVVGGGGGGGGAPP
ncbi:SUKH-3 domain-containing protein, partial [Amycolatopsis solani]|uniref:SUKH-3 domain-containing protein n=1 Tax=Amycolatopsis solani TaxID=3028615 RepID=UPI0025B1C123